MLLAGGAATAADIPLKAPPKPEVALSWTGFYVGAGAGFRSSETQANVTRAVDTTLPAAFGGDPFRGADCLPVPAGIPCVTGQQLNGTALRVSPYAGFNWQVWRAVLG